MKPTIVEVTTKKQLKAFVHWQNEFYKDCPYYTPAIEADEVTSLTPEGNAAFEFCTARSWLAYGPDGKIVGHGSVVAGLWPGRKDSRPCDRHHQSSR